MFVKFNDEILIKNIDYIIDEGKVVVKQHILDKYSIANTENDIKDSVICKYQSNGMGGIAHNTMRFKSGERIPVYSTNESYSVKGGKVIDEETCNEEMDT